MAGGSLGGFGGGYLGKGGNGGYINNCAGALRLVVYHQWCGSVQFYIFLEFSIVLQ